jgi:hypothetical protein
MSADPSRQKKCYLQNDNSCLRQALPGTSDGGHGLEATRHAEVASDVAVGLIVLTSLLRLKITW